MYNIVKETCSKCRSCCHSVKIPFKKDSVVGKLLKDTCDNGDLGAGQSLYEEPGHPEFWVYKSGDKGCLFLDYNTYTCTVQAIKPIVCKMFPLKWDNSLMYYIALCPIVFVIPLKDIYGWREGNKLEVKDVTYYVNPKEADDLLPLSFIFRKHPHFKEVLFSED